MSTPSRLRPLVSIAVALLAWPAQAAPKTREQREVEARYACNAGRVEVGIDLLAGLLTEYPHPNYIYNQARCYQQNGRPEEAVSRFREYLRVANRPSGEERARIERFIQELEAERQAAASAAAAALPAGPRVIPEAQPAAAPPVVVTQAPPLRRRSLLLPATGIVLGLGGVVTSVVASVKVRALNREVESAGYGQYTRQSLAEEAARGHRYETMQWVGYGLGGVALATSIVYLLVGGDRGGPEQAAHLQLAVAPDGAPHVSVSGRF